MKTTVICLCLLGIVCAFPVKQTNSGSSEETHNAVSTEDVFSQESIPNSSNESQDHMDDTSDKDEDALKVSLDSNDSDDDDDDDEETEDSDNSDESHQSDESDETTIKMPTDTPAATLVFSQSTPTNDMYDGRGDNVAYGLRSKAKKLHRLDIQYPGETEEDLTSYMESREGTDLQKDAPSLQVSAAWESHPSLGKAGVSHESHSQELHSQENSLHADPLSKEDRQLKFHISHELEDSVSSEVN